VPPQPVPLNEEFEAMSVSNGAGGAVTIFVTVTSGSPNNPGQVQARSVQTGPESANFVLLNVDGSVMFAFPCPFGDTNLVNLPGGISTNVTWATARRRVYLQGA
jgi:hypothetical protein